MGAPRTLQLPSPEQVERADHNLGVVSSDLDAILTAVRTTSEHPSLEDARFMEAAGIQSPDETPVEREALVRLLVFAADLADRAEWMRVQAQECPGCCRGRFTTGAPAEPGAGSATSD